MTTVCCKLQFSFHSFKLKIIHFRDSFHRGKPPLTPTSFKVKTGPSKLALTVPASSLFPHFEAKIAEAPDKRKHSLFQTEKEFAFSPLFRGFVTNNI